MSRKLIATLSILLATLSTADAGTYVGARAGAAAFAGTPACWHFYGPSVTNACIDTQYWHIELPVADNRVNPAVGITVVGISASSTSLIRCRATVTTWNGGVVNLGDWYNPAQIGTPVAFDLPGVSVPNSYTLGIDCALGSGSTMTMVWYR